MHDSYNQCVMRFSNNHYEMSHVTAITTRHVDVMGRNRKEKANASHCVIYKMIWYEKINKHTQQLRQPDTMGPIANDAIGNY